MESTYNRIKDYTLYFVSDHTVQIYIYVVVKKNVCIFFLIFEKKKKVIKTSLFSLFQFSVY